MTIKQAKYEVVQYLYWIRFTDFYRDNGWMLTPKKWIAYSRAYDRWIKKQDGLMPLPKHFV